MKKQIRAKERARSLVEQNAGVPPVGHVSGGANAILVFAGGE
jgi:hypothetical protein